MTAVRFFHSADWQMRMRARHVAKVADRVRAARLDTAGRTLALGQDRGVHFILIAEDLSA